MSTPDSKQTPLFFTAITLHRANLRTRPNLSAPIITEIPLNTPVSIDGWSGNWASVRFQDKQGYIRQDLVRARLPEELLKNNTCHPLVPQSVVNIHSAFLYNLESFRGMRDGFGRSREGAWGKSAGKLCFGEDVWSGRIIPKHGGTGDGYWHGAVDVVPRGQKRLPVWMVADGVVVSKFAQALITQHEWQDKTYYVFYQHIVPFAGLEAGQKIKAGTQIGRLKYLSGGIHLHFELHSAQELWQGCAEDVKMRGFYIDYGLKHLRAAGLHGQFSRDSLPEEIRTRDLCYNGLAWLVWLRGEMGKKEEPAG